MTALQYAATDSLTMLRRNVRHIRRYPSMTLMIIGLPVVFLMLFVYVFGGTLGAGLGGPSSGGRAAYVNYVTPGIILMTVAGAATATAVAIATDMTEGIIARFRTMAIFRPSILIGHVTGAVINTLLAMVVVIGVALLVGFRPSAGAVEWLATGAVLTLFVVAITWLSVALGLMSKTVEGASNAPTPLLFLPFLGSGFVPTDSMPTGLRWFAEYQPFTPVIETVRGLLMGNAIGDRAVVAVVWSAGLTLVGYGWARWLFDRDPSR